MKISLRKANALQLSINEVLKSFEFDTKITIDEFQDPSDLLINANVKFNQTLNRRAALLDVLFEIRKETSKTNHTAGIDTKLADIARLEKEISIYQTILSSATPAESTEIVAQRLDKIRNKSEQVYYGNNTISSSILTEIEIENIKVSVSNFKKRKQILQDELLELNISSTFVLSQRSVDTLTSESLV